MSKKLESYCQQELVRLLKQREHFKSRKCLRKDSECDLPHYSTFLSIFTNIERQELYLMEIESKISDLKRTKEINTIKDAISSLRFVKHRQAPVSSLRTWFIEMTSCEKISSTDNGLQNVKYFDIDFCESNDQESLSWTTRFKGRSIRITLTAPLWSRSSYESDFHLTSSLYVDGMVSEGKRCISSGKTVEEYIKIVWMSLEKLIIAIS